MQVMHADIAADWQAFVAGTLQQCDAGGAGNAREVQPGAGAAYQFQRGGDGRRFCGRRNTRQAEAGGHFSIVGDTVAGEVLVLRLQVQRIAEGGSVLHCAQQHLGVDDRRVAALREGDAAGLGETAEFGQGFALEAGGQRANRQHAGEAGVGGTTHEAFDQPGFVERRAGVGWAGKRGDAAGNCGGEFILETRQAGGEIDQAGADDGATGLDDTSAGKAVWRLADGSDAAVGKVQVKDVIDAMFRIDQAAVLDGNFFASHFSSPQRCS